MTTYNTSSHQIVVYFETEIQSSGRQTMERMKKDRIEAQESEKERDRERKKHRRIICTKPFVAVSGANGMHSVCLFSAKRTNKPKYTIYA